MKKKKFPFRVTTAVLLSASAVLLIGSTVGSTRAALTYYSENYGAEVTVSNIGVSLLENGETVSRRDYDSNGEWNETIGTLLADLQEETIVPGKEYDEALAVSNSGSIDSYVRVILNKSWTDSEGSFHSGAEDPVLHKYPSGGRDDPGAVRYGADRSGGCG